MSPFRQIVELARRDFMQRLRSKAFLMAMLLTVGIVIIIGPIIALASGDDSPTVVALVGEQPAGSEQAIREQSALLDIDVRLQRFGSLAAAEAALAQGEVAIVVNGTDELVFDDEPLLRLSAAVSGGIATAQRIITAQELGLSESDVGELLFPVQFNERTIEPAATEEDEVNEVAALVALMLLYISILVFGQFVMMGVMEEKQTRVVEVVLSRVKPTQVLVGKVLGVGLLGLIQIVALGAALIFTVSVADLADFDLTGLGFKVLGLLVLWYLLGYAFYSFMYGALGATISRQEDMQGVAMLPVLLILPGFFLGQMALLEPDLWFNQAASLIPLWSPMVMAVRSTTSDVPVWEVILAVVLLVATTALLIKLGGRIYRGAILQSGRKTKLRAAWRSADD
jgi:ABC-2 type transport system permease protein